MTGLSRHSARIAIAAFVAITGIASIIGSGGGGGSDDGGTTFYTAGRQVLSGLRGLTALSGTGHVGAWGSDGVWESTDGGVTWRPVFKGLRDPDVRDLVEITGGEAFSATDTQSLKAIFTHIDRMKPARFAPAGTVPLDAFGPFALVALALAGLRQLGRQAGAVDQVDLVERDDLPALVEAGAVRRALRVRAAPTRTVTTVAAMATAAAA